MDDKKSLYVCDCYCWAKIQAFKYFLRDFLVFLRIVMLQTLWLRNNSTVLPILLLLDVWNFENRHKSRDRLNYKYELYLEDSFFKIIEWHNWHKTKSGWHLCKLYIAVIFSKQSI